MEKEIVLGEPEDTLENAVDSDAVTTDPDEFFKKNAFRMVYQTNNFFLPQIRDLIDKGEILNLRPEYQRRLRWNSVQKSRLIESLLLNIPVPPIFLYESKAARYEVMDGQQRLNAVREFVAGDFNLTGLKVLKPLNGLSYSRCPPRIKRTLDRSSISAIVLLLESGTDDVASHRTLDDIRGTIFDRLNTGGTKLNPQELRNAVYPGEFNKSLINLTRYSLFTEVFDIPPYVEADPNDYYENPTRQKNILYASMGDCQLVLRYFALKEDENIRGSMKLMLDRAMANRTGLNKDACEKFEEEFKARFSYLYNLFGGAPFTLPTNEKKSSRVSAALYDALMVAIDQKWGHRDDIEHDKSGVASRLNSALAEDSKFKVLTGYGNTAQAVRDRIVLANDILLPIN